MAKRNDNLTWKVIDPQSLTKDQQAAYTAYKDAAKKAAALRKAFTDLVEKDMLPHIPGNKKPVFSFNFGNLSIAIADRETTKAATLNSAFTLADYLKHVA